MSDFIPNFSLNSNNERTTERDEFDDFLYGLISEIEREADDKMEEARPKRSTCKNWRRDEMRRELNE